MISTMDYHRMVWVGKDLSSKPPTLGRDTFHQTRLLKAPSNLALNTSMEGAATTYLGNLFQCLTILIVKNFFLISNLNLPSVSLKPLSLVLSLHAFVKSSFFFKKILMSDMKKCRDHLS